MSSVRSFIVCLVLFFVSVSADAQTVSMYPNKINDVNPVNTSRQQWVDVAATTGTATFDFYFNVSKFRADRAASSVYGGAYTVVVVVDTVSGGSGVAAGDMDVDVTPLIWSDLWTSGGLYMLSTEPGDVTNLTTAFDWEANHADNKFSYFKSVNMAAADGVRVTIGNDAAEAFRVSVQLRAVSRDRGF